MLVISGFLYACGDSSQRLSVPSQAPNWESTVALLESEHLSPEVPSFAAASYIRPVAGPITSGFRTASRPGHNAVDIGASYRNVVAARSGTTTPSYNEANGCGLYMYVQHDQSRSIYCHLSRVTVAGARAVGQGALIAVSGNSGRSTGPHLHFGIFLNSRGDWVDPRFYTQF